MRFEELLAGTYDDCNYQSAPAAAVVTRLKRYVNEGYRAVLAEPGMARLVDSDGPWTFATTADVARYALPTAHAQIRRMTDRDNDRRLDFLSLSDYRTIAPDPTTSTGRPVAWVPIGSVAVAVQPSDASEIFAKSSSGSDTQTIYLEGIRADGTFHKVSVSLNGATAVSLDTGITNWIEVTKWYLASSAAGAVTLHEDSGAGTTLGTIGVGTQVPQYTGFYLWPTPSGAVTYHVDTRREHTDLVESDDVPVLPSDFHPMLIKYATFREWEHKDDAARATLAFQQYSQWLSKLKYWLLNTGDTVPVARNGGSQRIGINRVGPWYPAGYGW